MASIKIVLRKKSNSHGQFPIAIRITKDRKSSFIYTGQYVFAKDWDAKNQKVKKSHPNSARLNNHIAHKLAESNDKLLELENETASSVSARYVSSRIKRVKKDKSFFTLADKYMQQLVDAKKFNRLSAEKSHLKHFQEYLKGEDISFQEITENVLTGFQAYLRATRDINERTVVNHLIVIRTILNVAIRDGLIDRRFYPFGKGKIVIRFPQHSKIGLSQEDVQKLERYDQSPNNPRAHALNAWLLSFYFAGMRVSDILRLRWNDFQNNRLHYTMGKNRKTGSLKIPDKALKILGHYRNDKTQLDYTVLPELRDIEMNDIKTAHKSIKNAVKKFNKHLKTVAKELEINKPLTMHIARHTFGNLSGDRIPLQMLQKLYRHTSITTTINYQANFIHKDADEALDSVLDF